MANVIGFSGLHGSVAFKAKHFPGLTQRQSGIVFGLDSAAALVTDDGIVAAAAEERFTREKATGAFPRHAIASCLAAGRLRPSDIDFVAHGWDFECCRELHRELGAYTREQFDFVLSADAQRGWLRELLPEGHWDEKLVSVPHHLAHAASTFYPSGLDDALILVVDGMGEQHSTTIAVGQGDDIRIVKQVPALHSLGVLYGLFTLYLGFQFGMDEYKVMGLAPYGRPEIYRDRIASLVQFRPDGSFTNPILYENHTQAERETFSGSLRALAEMLGPARDPESEISARHQDVAAGLQAVLEESLLRILRQFRQETGQRNLCMAGGVALNCSANGAIRRSGLFDRIFIQPAAGDDGTALGAALYVHRQHAPARRSISTPSVSTPRPAPVRMGLPLLGPDLDPAAVLQALQTLPAAQDVEYTLYQSFDRLAVDVARRIAAGDIVGWYQGRMEYGPRALGSRSILADARAPDMREKINRLVKKREAFRPFAPAVTAEQASRFFEIDDVDEQAYACMLMVTKVRPAYRELLPAVTHVDGSARVQIVSRDAHESFWTLIDQVGQLTGVPVVLNTSFNVRGQPIVNTPIEAIETFLDATLDVLVLGQVMAVRRGAARTRDVHVLAANAAQR